MVSELVVSELVVSELVVSELVGRELVGRELGPRELGPRAHLFANAWRATPIETRTNFGDRGPWAQRSQMLGMLKACDGRRGGRLF